METSTLLLTEPLNDRFIGCDFCTEASSDCRLLPCLHVVCKNCLEDSQQLLTVKDDDDILTCPVCGQRTSNAVETAESSDHRRSQPQGLLLSPTVNSGDRDTKAMEKSSCGGCQQILCVACLASSDGLGIMDSVKASREAVERMASDAAASKTTALKKLESIDAEKQEFLSRADHLRCDVNRAREQLKGIVDRHADSLLGELSAWEEETVRATKVDIDSLCRYVSSLDRHKTSCVEALARGSTKDIDSIGRDHLFQMPPLKFEGQMNTLHVNLEQTKINDLLIAYNDNIIGILKDEELPEFEEKEKRSEEIHFDDQPHFARLKHLHQTPKRSDSKGCIEFKEDPVLIRTLKTQPAAKDNRGILGATVLDDELYAVTKDSSEVEVFDVNRLMFSCELEVGDLFNPEDIAACSVLKCLYIMDCKTSSRSTNKILRIDRNGKLIRKWSTEEDWGHLSVSPKTNLLLSVYNRNRLKEYSPLGYLVRVVDLSSFDHIRHAIQLTSGHYLVSHGETGDGVHRVAKVDSTGNTVRSFTSEAPNPPRPMKRPFYLETIDDDEGASAAAVLVADADNGRVLLVNSRLEFERELVSSDKHGLRYPVRICLDRRSARLFVVDNQVGNKRICVFDVR